MAWRKKEQPTTYSGSKLGGSERPAPGCNHQRNESVSRRTLHDRVLVTLRCSNSNCRFEWERFET